MPNKGNKILKYKHGENSTKASFIIHADLECLLEKSSTCHSKPEKSFTEKKINVELLVIQCLHITHLIQ